MSLDDYNLLGFIDFTYLNDENDPGKYKDFLKQAALIDAACLCIYPKNINEIHQLIPKKNMSSLDSRQICSKLAIALGNLGAFSLENNTFIEKSLENFFYIEIILKIFPKAKFINTSRNTTDNILAIFQQFLSKISWSHSLEDILEYTNNYLKIIVV